MFKIIVLLMFLISNLFCSINYATPLNMEEVKALLPRDLNDELPTVMVAIMVRNKAHILPRFLTHLEKLNYPKHRMALWLRSDHNFDDSIQILELWLKHNEVLYHHVNYEFNDTVKHYQNESSPFDWPFERFEQIIRHKELAFNYAQNIWADYIFYLDADVFLTNSETLKFLIDLKLPLVAPMLLSDGLYSNFWGGMSLVNYYYLRTDDYKEIYNVNQEGLFHVPMIHSAVLINLNYKGSQYLTFDRERLILQQNNSIGWLASGVTTLNPMCRPYDGPMDDIIIFAVSANCSQIPLFVSNHLPYGYIMSPLEPNEGVQQDQQTLINIKVNMIHDMDSLIELNPYLKTYELVEKKHKLSLNHIYMINLDRRPGRRRKMMQLFEVLGLEVEHFLAVDGQKLNRDILQEMGINFLPTYEDPYHKRPMTMGEIGCFLSHFHIWQDVIKKEYKEVLILEDDIRFEPYFKQNAEKVINQARQLSSYDLIYFGRKRLKEESEPLVENTTNLVYAGYSYWTLGYVLTLNGAKKLVNAKPLQKLLPVDEFLPIMFNRHPNDTWSSAFLQRNLKAYSASPLLLYPTHYTGDNGYISDTEDSLIVKSNHNESFPQTAQLKSDRGLDFTEMPTLTKALHNQIKEADKSSSIFDGHEEL